MSLSEAVSIFNEHAVGYDKWYDNSALFGMEIEVICNSSLDFPLPRLEVGVGTGRFAQALGIDFGLDPALSPLQLAKDRSIIPVNGTGEQMPAFDWNDIPFLHPVFSDRSCSGIQRIFPGTQTGRICDDRPYPCSITMGQKPGNKRA